MYLYNAEYKSTLRSGDQRLGGPCNPESITSWQLISGLSLRSWLSFCLCVPPHPHSFFQPHPLIGGELLSVCWDFQVQARVKLYKHPKSTTHLPLGGCGLSQWVEHLLASTWFV